MTNLPSETLTQIEDGIISVLEPGPDGVRVEPYPGDPSTYRMTTQGALLVLLESEQYSNDIGEVTGLVNLERTPRFNVIAVHKQRRTDKRREGHGAVYSLVDYAKDELAGAGIDGYTALPQTLQPLGLNPGDNTWRYQLTFDLRDT